MPATLSQCQLSATNNLRHKSEEGLTRDKRLRSYLLRCIFEDQAIDSEGFSS